MYIMLNSVFIDGSPTCHHLIYHASESRRVTVDASCVCQRYPLFFVSTISMRLLSVKNKAFILSAVATIGFASVLQAAPQLLIDVHRDPNCGCCSKWMAYLKEHGYTVVDHLEDNMSQVKEKLGVPAQLGSCHTGVVNGKFVEGHVPVEQIAELTRRTDLIGVAAPGMPMGSAGMESGDRRSAYQIIGLTKAGAEEVIADYPAR